MLRLPEAGVVRVGAGLQQSGGALVTNRGGVLRQTKGGKLWVEGSQKRRAPPVPRSSARDGCVATGCVQNGRIAHRVCRCSSTTSMSVGRTPSQRSLPIDWVPNQTAGSEVAWEPVVTPWARSAHRYLPAADDKVIGVVLERFGESFNVDVGGPFIATLSALAFEGAHTQGWPLHVDSPATSDRARLTGATMSFVLCAP